MAKYRGTNINDEYGLYIKVHPTMDESIDRVMKVVEEKLLGELVIEIHKRLFNGKYYSNSFNYAQLLSKFNIDSYTYNDSIRMLCVYGIIEKVGERVYKFCDEVVVEEIDEESKTEYKR